MTHLRAIEHPIFKTIQNAGESLNQSVYVIGGFVRDFVLKRNSPTDIDIVTTGNGIELAQKVASLLPNTPKVQVFKTYGTAMLKYKELELEFVGARKESYRENSRNPSVTPGSLEDDQKRRDFTINALAIALNNSNLGQFLDPFNGIKDIENKTLKTPLNPDITFSDDPLRMLRAVRFACQLNFTIDSNTFDAICKNHSRISIITKERIQQELNKIMKSPKPSVGFIYLEKSGLLKNILPELVDLKGVEEIEGQKHKDNFYHTLEVLDNISKTSDNLWLRWAALLHDIGKAPTKRFVKPIGWTFHGHEFKGGKMVYPIFKRLKMPLGQPAKYVKKLVQLSSRPIALVEDNISDAAIRRLIFESGNDLEDLMLLCEADITTKNKKRFQKYHNNFKWVRNKMALIEEKDKVRNFQPPIDGEEIMKIFDISPSKEVGILKDAIKEAILEGDIPNQYNTAFDFLIKEAKKLGLSIKQKLNS